MGRRANPTLIGAFIVGAVALIVIGLLVFGRAQFFTEKGTFVLYFDGSVKGLGIGAPVDFQGVRVGSVTNIRVQVLPGTNEVRTPVYIEIERNRIGEGGTRKAGEDRLSYIKALVQRGLRARLESQSIVTGQLVVQLGFYPDTPIRLVMGDPDTIELPTIPTTLQQAQAAAQDILEKLQQLPLDQLFAHFMQTIEGANRLVNSPELPELLRSLNSAQADVVRMIQQVEKGIPPVLDEVRGASASLRALLIDVQQLVRRVDGQVVPVAESAKQTLEAARATLKDGQQLVRSVDGRVGRLADSFTDTAKAAQTTIATAQRRIDDNLVGALQELSSAARAIRVLADYLERNPNALLYGKGGDRR
jgi:paraquat-inducible protein B